MRSISRWAIIAFAACAVPAMATLFGGSTLLAQQPADSISGEAERPFLLDEVVVTATPTPLPAGALGMHVSVLDGEALRARGVTRVADALRSEAGVSIARSGSYGATTSVFMRGGESDYVQVMIDGVPINNPGGAVDLAGLTMDAVERIEIVRGPVSALYGSDAVAGVIHIITRTGTEDAGTAGSVSLRGGSYDRLDAGLELRGGDEDASYGVALGRDRTDGILAFNNAHENTVLTGNARLRLDDRSRARLSVRLTDRSFHFPTDGSGAVVDTNQFTFSDANTIGVEVERLFGPVDGGAGAVDVRVLFSLHDQETGIDDPLDDAEDTSSFQSLDAMRRAAADLRASWTVTESGTLIAGAEVESQRIRSFSESVSSFGTSNDRSENARTNRAGYLHGVLGLDGVDLTSGVRVEDNEQYGSFFTWQAGASWAVVEGTRLRASTGRAIKEPTFFEAYATGVAIGNPELDPERSTSWEIGAEQDLGGSARVTATWFDQSFRDLIQYTSTPPTPGDPNYFNVAAADARGMELTLEAAVRGIGVAADWTYLDTEVRDSGFQEGAGATFVEGEPLLRRPEHQLGLTLSGGLGARLRWSAEARHLGEREDRDFSVFPAAPVTLDAYTTLGAALEVQMIDPAGRSAGVDLFLEGQNLTGQSYQEVFGFPAPGRAVFVGASVGFGG